MPRPPIWPGPDIVSGPGIMSGLGIELGPGGKLVWAKTGAAASMASIDAVVSTFLMTLLPAHCDRSCARNGPVFHEFGGRTIS
jgi:hypothetical protein